MTSTYAYARFEQHASDAGAITHPCKFELHLSMSFKLDTLCTKNCACVYNQEKLIRKFLIWECQNIFTQRTSFKSHSCVVSCNTFDVKTLLCFFYHCEFYVNALLGIFLLDSPEFSLRDLASIFWFSLMMFWTIIVLNIFW